MMVRPIPRPRLGVALLALALVWPGRAEAQYTEVPAPAAYALENVTVVHADGRRDEGVNVVIRGRFIEAIGARVAIPADAQALEGEGLVVYPGLIDAHGDAKHSFPRPEVDRRQVHSWDPPRALQGFTPHRRVVDVLEATGADVETQRKRGVIALAVHPGDAMMPGRGALLLLRNGAATPAELVLEPVLGPVMSFRGGQGVYPGTLFGVKAFYRQSFEDAARHRLVAAEHARDPRGLTPPAYDPDYAVIQEAMDGRVPVYFQADRAEDIRRALGIAERHGLRLVVLGGQEAWKVADALRARDVPVFASVAFDSPRHWRPDQDAGRADDPEAGLDDVVPVGPTGADRPDPVILKERQRFEELYANAARLAEAGVRFALTSGGGGTDLREGVRKAIEYGLDESVALRAVTSAPAELLGVPHLVRIEAGMPASFTVASGPLFDQETRIAYTFVEGALQRGEEARPARGGNGAATAVDVSGRWSIEISSEMGVMTGTMTLRQDGADFTGSIAADQIGEMAIRSGNVAGNRLTFVIAVDAGGESVTLDSEATVEGEEMTGTSESPFVRATFKATRIGGPGGAR